MSGNWDQLNAQVKVPKIHFWPLTMSLAQLITRRPSASTLLVPLCVSAPCVRKPGRGPKEGGRDSMEVGGINSPALTRNCGGTT
jgi:hypothetical protein